MENKEIKTDYTKENDFYLYREYDFLTYNLWLMRNEYRRGHTNLLAKDFVKLDEENMAYVTPCLKEAIKRKGQGFPEWLIKNKSFVNNLSESEYEELHQVEEKYLKSDFTSDCLDKFLSLHGYEQQVNQNPEEK